MLYPVRADARNRPWRIAAHNVSIFVRNRLADLEGERAVYNRDNHKPLSGSVEDIQKRLSACWLVKVP